LRAPAPPHVPVASPAAPREEVQGLACTSALAASEKKAEDVLVLDLHGLSDACDFFVIASGRSDTQVRGIAEHVIDTLEQGGTGSPWHVEGMAAGRWVLLDYIDFVVHVFHHEVREYYQLERLWGDAPLVEWSR
jgi:ribosome-associated protein